MGHFQISRSIFKVYNHFNPHEKKISMKNTKLEEQLLIKLFLNLVIFKNLYLVSPQFLVQDIKASLEYADFYT